MVLSASRGGRGEVGAGTGGIWDLRCQYCGLPGHSLLSCAETSDASLAVARERSAKLPGKAAAVPPVPSAEKPGKGEICVGEVQLGRRRAQAWEVERERGREGGSDGGRDLTRMMQGIGDMSKSKSGSGNSGSRTSGSGRGGSGQEGEAGGIARSCLVCLRAGHWAQACDVLSPAVRESSSAFDGGLHLGLSASTYVHDGKRGRRGEEEEYDEGRGAGKKKKRGTGWAEEGDAEESNQQLADPFGSWDAYKVRADEKARTGGGLMLVSPAGTPGAGVSASPTAAAGSGGGGGGCLSYHATQPSGGGTTASAEKSELMPPPPAPASLAQPYATSAVRASPFRGPQWSLADPSHLLQVAEDLRLSRRDLQR